MTNQLVHRLLVLIDLCRGLGCNIRDLSSLTLCCFVSIFQETEHLDKLLISSHDFDEISILLAVLYAIRTS